MYSMVQLINPEKYSVDTHPRIRLLGSLETTPVRSEAVFHSCLGDLILEASVHSHFSSKEYVT